MRIWVCTLEHKSLKESFVLRNVVLALTLPVFVDKWKKKYMKLPSVSIASWLKSLDHTSLQNYEISKVKSRNFLDELEDRNNSLLISLHFSLNLNPSCWIKQKCSCPCYLSTSFDHCETWLVSVWYHSLLFSPLRSESLFQPENCSFFQRKLLKRSDKHCWRLSSKKSFLSL